MKKSLPERMSALGDNIRRRRVALRMTQQEAAKRSGVSYSTWRRMEGEGKASIEDLVRAATVLRCDDELAALFPRPAAKNMDELLQRQRLSSASKLKRVSRSVW